MKTMTRALCLAALLASAACGADSPTAPSSASTQQLAAAGATAAADCADAACLFSNIQVNGNHLTIRVFPLALEDVRVEQLQRDGSWQDYGKRVQRSPVEWDVEVSYARAPDTVYIYRAVAVYKGQRYYSRDLPVGRENECGGCVNVPTTPGPAPTPPPPPSVPLPPPVDACDSARATVTWTDTATAARMDRETATVTVPAGCTTAGFYYVAWGYTAEGEPHRIDVEMLESGGVHLAGAWAGIYPRWMVELRDGRGVVLSMVEGVTRQ